METEEEVDILMSSDVYSATLSTKSITFSRAQTGWLFREDKTVGVSRCSCDCWYQDIINPTTTAGASPACGISGSLSGWSGVFQTGKVWENLKDRK